MDHNNTPVAGPGKPRTCARRTRVLCDVLFSDVAAMCWMSLMSENVVARPRAPHAFPRSRRLTPMKRTLAYPLVVIGLVCAAMLARTSPAQTTEPSNFPKPSLYPIAWELKFEHKIPKRIVVDIPGAAAPQAYWYMTYAVTNNTDK